MIHVVILGNQIHKSGGDIRVNKNFSEQTRDFLKNYLNDVDVCCACKFLFFDMSDWYNGDKEKYDRPKRHFVRDKPWRNKNIILARIKAKYSILHLTLNPPSTDKGTTALVPDTRNSGCWEFIFSRYRGFHI